MFEKIKPQKLKQKKQFYQRVFSRFHYSKMKQKCRAKFDTLSEEERGAIVARCVNVEFSTTCFICPQLELQRIWQQMSCDPRMCQITESCKFETCASKIGNIENVIAIDGAVVKKTFTTTHEQIGDALKTIMRLAIHEPHVSDGGAMESFLRKMLGNDANSPVAAFQTPYSKLIHVDENWCDQGKFEKTIRFNGQTLRVFVICWGGSQKCPFQSDSDTSYHGYDYGAHDVVITNVDNGEALCYSSLLPHMIKHHHFFEGPLCLHRVEPKQIVKVIGTLDANKSYRIRSERHMEWCPKSVWINGAFAPPTEFVVHYKLSHYDIYVTKREENGDAFELQIHYSDNEQKDNNEDDDTPGKGKEELEASVTDEDRQILSSLHLTLESLPEVLSARCLIRKLTKSYLWDEWLQDQPLPPAAIEATFENEKMGLDVTLLNVFQPGE